MAYIVAVLLTFVLVVPASGQECTAANTHPTLTALDHDSMLAAYTASFRGVFGRNPTMVDGAGYDDGEYWIRVSNHYGQFGDSICRAGWNAYWEQKLACRCDAVDPKLGDQPAHFQPASTPAQPPVVNPPPVPVFDASALLAAIQNMRTEDDKRFDALDAAVAKVQATEDDHWSQLKAVFGNPYVQSALVAFTTWFTTHQVTK